MIPWKTLDREAQLEPIAAGSHRRPVTIYKHSTRCSLSLYVREQLESEWDIPGDELDVYFLNVIEHRDLSNAVARLFDVVHESPQILLIRDGRVVYSASHGSVTARALKKALADPP